jgi:hypothetical protein
MVRLPELPKAPKSLSVALAVVLLVAAAYFSYLDLQKAIERSKPWMEPVVTQAEFKALDWVRANTKEREVFAADIFGSEIIFGQTLREGTEGGDWAIIPNVVQRMSDVDRLFKTTDAKEASELSKKYNASYVWLPSRQIFAGYGWFSAERSKFENETFFERVYSQENIEIYRVK